ncbi:hypothetical protein ES703_55699 [subsurface metagenome]
MFVRIKKSGKYQYLQVVENRRSFGVIQQRIIGNMGRLDEYKKGNNFQQVVTSLIKAFVKYNDGIRSMGSPKKRIHKKPVD